MADAKYSVSWDDYRKSICNGLSGLQQRGEFVDMTLAADGHRVMAHKMVLSLVSPYIRDLVDSTACHHPILFLNKVSHQTLQSILEYAYTGEVVVANERIQEFLSACKELRIRGLEGTTMNVENAQQATCTDMDMDTQEVSSNMDTPQVNNTTDKEPQTVRSAESPSFGNDDDSDNESAASFDDDVDNESRSPINKPVSKPIASSNSDTPDIGLKFTISNQGSAQIVLNRFLYHHRHTRKNGETLWRCFNYTRPTKLKQRCRAFVVLKDNKVVQRSCAHNHAFHDDKILRRVRVRNMFTSLTETQKIIKEKTQKNIEKKEAINQMIGKRAPKNIEKNEAKNQAPEQKSISRPQSEMERDIEYIEII